MTGDPSAGAALTTLGLRKRYGARAALDGLDLAVPRGVVYGFLGPNGAGKTTTLRLLVGLIRPDAGQIEVLGRPYSWRDRRRLFDVGALIETPAFYPYLSGRDNLRVVGASGPPAPTSRVEEVLDFVGMRERGKDKFKTYSLGMKQRLGIAAAMLNDPQLLLLDEPANGLDPAGIVSMRETLRYLTSTGKTVIVSSHILPEVQQLADVVGIIARGRLVREGTMAELLQEGSHVRVRVSPDDVPRATEVLAALNPEVLPPAHGLQPGWIKVSASGAQAGEINRMLAQGGVYARGLESGNDLESVFLSLTRPAAA